MAKMRLFNGKCQDVLQQLIDENIKVDAVITDPPYNISKQNNFQSMGRSGIYFGDWDIDFDITTPIKLCKNLIKKDGSIFIFNSWRNLGTIADALEENNFEVKDIFRYIKRNPMPRNRDRRYITDYEFAIWAVVKGGKWTFNRQNDTYDRPEFECSIPKCEFHPNQKPIELMLDIIKRHVPLEGGTTCLDFCMGSGTNGIACKQLDVDFIGIELEKKYFDIAKGRILQ